MVTSEHPEKLNLTGLVLMSILQQNLERSAMVERAKRLRGKVGIQAGRMKVTVNCESGRFVVNNGLDPVHAAVLVGLTAIFLAIAIVTFERRDLAV